MCWCFWSLCHRSSARSHPRIGQLFQQSFAGWAGILLRDLKLDKAADRKKLSVALVDITDPSQPQLAAINGDRMMYAASLPKIAILLGAFEKIDRGEMKLDSATQETLTRMIRNSSNRAATKMLNRVGKVFLADLLQSDKYRLYDPQYNGGLWVGKEYGKAGPGNVTRWPTYHTERRHSKSRVSTICWKLDSWFHRKRVGR